MSPHPDHRYLTALRDNDSRTIGELYQSSFPKINQWVLRNNGSEEDARDVFQEALVSLYRHAHNPDYTLVCPIGALLFSICRNKWIDQLRKKSKDDRVREVEGARYTSDERVESAYEIWEEGQIRKKKLDRSLAQLSETCRKLLRLLGQGEAAKEAAEKMGMANANTLYRRKNACLQRWRELFNSLK